MSDQWPTEPGQSPPVPPSTPAGWGGPATPPPVAPPPYGGGPAASPSGPGRDGNRTTLVIAATVVVLILLAGGGIIWWLNRPTDQPLATAPGTSTTTATSTTTTTPPTTTSPGTSTTIVGVPTPTTPAGPAPTQAELEAAVADLSKFVEKERGLKFKTPVKVELVADDEFNQRLLKGFDEEQKSLEKLGTELKALQLVPKGVDVVAASKKMLTAGVLGFYDPESKELLVRGVALNPFVRQTIVHELTHALDDQTFDINRKQYDDRKDEIGFGFSALNEGDARRVENAYNKTLTPQQQAERDQEETAFAAGADLSGVPIILLKLLEAPYDLGEPFVGKLWAKGQPTLDGAFADPPDTSEQVMHPEKYLTRDPRVDVPHPTPDGAMVDEGVFGELMILVTLEDGVATDAAQRAAAGWAGDWYVTWNDQKNGNCIRINIKMETPKDLQDLSAAFQQWAKSRSAQIEVTAPDSLQVTSCSAAAGGGRSPA